LLSGLVGLRTDSLQPQACYSLPPGMAPEERSSTCCPRPSSHRVSVERSSQSLRKCGAQSQLHTPRADQLGLPVCRPCSNFASDNSSCGSSLQMMSATS
jgi:hypothetical protein